MSYTFSVYTSIKELPINWKQFLVSNENICKSIDIVENSAIENIKNYYVVTKENDKIIYLSYYQLLQVTPNHFNISDKKIQQIGLTCALTIVKPTLLVVGNLFRHDVLFFQSLDETSTNEKIALLYQATVDFMVKETNASGIFLKDVEKEIAPYILQNETYTPMPDDISMEMNLPATWLSMVDYEKILKHKYAQRYRKIKKSFEEVVIKEFTIDDIEKYKNEILQLYLQVTKKQIVSMGILNEQFFIELKKALQNEYIICGYFFDKKLIAFSSSIIHNGEYDMNYIGFDYAYNTQLNLYFNILFHCIEMAMQFKCHKLILGRTAIEAKAIIGCSPNYRYSFYKLRNRIVNWFFQRISSYFREQQGDSWKNRHPFKSENYTSQ